MLERINLTPQMALAQRIKQITPLVCLGLLLTGCLIVGFIGHTLTQKNTVLKREIGNLESQQAELLGQQAVIVQLAKKVKGMHDEEKKLRKIVANLLEIPKKKIHFSKFLNAISELLPPSARCEKIVLDKDGGEIVGRATEYGELPAFVQKLSEKTGFRSVSLHVVNQNEDKDELLSFTITFKLRPLQ